MTFKDGDFVKIEYSIWRGSDNALVMTTEKKLAEENGSYNKEFTYEPHLVIVGKDNMIKGVIEEIKSMSIGEKKKFEVKPENAFGERIQELVKVLPVSDFRKRDMDPVPGMQVEIDGAIAMVRSVNSGRVMIDANHPLAGETISCEVKILKKLEGTDEKARCIIEQRGLKPDTVQLNGKTLVVGFGTSIKKDGQYFIDKSSAVDTIINMIEGLDKVVIEEEYKKSEDKKQE